MYTYMCITKSFYVPKTQYCKSTIRQLKKKKRMSLHLLIVNLQEKWPKEQFSGENRKAFRIIGR